MSRIAPWLALCALGIAVNAAHATTFQIHSTDGLGEGLNDTTPFTPEGGNNAVTLGAARLNVLEEAARIWSSLISSTVPILVDASVDPQTCTANSATLAAAGPTVSYRGFPGAPLPNVLYPSALADALAGVNLGEGSSSADLRVIINLSLNNDPACLGGSRFYYGFDHNSGNRFDLLEVLLHEFAHGLGFSSRVNVTTGEGSISSTDGVERFNSYDQFIIDEFLNQPLISLTASQRIQSATRTGFLAWTGANANKWRNRYTAGVTANGRLRLYAPATAASGSSISHWDTALTPNALMEPFLNFATNNFTDITACALKDIGWTVTRCIDAANATPVAQAQTITVLEDTPISIMLSGSDADGDSLTYLVTTSPTRGTLSALSSGALPTALFSPSQNANGADSFTFTVADDSSTSMVGTVTINITPVNDAPAATPLTATAQSGQSAAIALTGTDVDGDALTFTVVTSPSSGTIAGTPPNITYRSNTGFTGSDSFTYRANDAALGSAPVTVSITVTPAPPSTSGGGGGGGGATGLSFLALLAGLLARARMRAARQATDSFRN